MSTEDLSPAVKQQKEFALELEWAASHVAKMKLAATQAVKEKPAAVEKNLENVEGKREDGE